MGLAVYGKVPMRGDFIERRAPADFVQIWHAWAAEGLSAGKAEFEDAWPRVYGRAPLWRFALAPDVCGAAPALGVLSPSIDSVGRFFPLAALFFGPAEAPPLARLAENEAWFARVEAKLLEFFRAGAELDEALSGLAGEEPPQAARDDKPQNDDCATVFAAPAFGLAALVAQTSPPAKAAFWSVDGVEADGGRKSALLLRDTLPSADDWPLICGVCASKGQSE